MRALHSVPQGKRRSAAIGLTVAMLLTTASAQETTQPPVTPTPRQLALRPITSQRTPTLVLLTGPERFRLYVRPDLHNPRHLHQDRLLHHPRPESTRHPRRLGRRLPRLRQTPWLQSCHEHHPELLHLTRPGSRRLGTTLRPLPLHRRVAPLPSRLRQKLHNVRPQRTIHSAKHHALRGAFGARSNRRDLESK